MRATKKGSKAEGRNRKNDLYARGMPSAKTITEIKHLAAVKMTTVGEIIHREHQAVTHFRDLVRVNDPERQITVKEIGVELARFHLAPESV